MFGVETCLESAREFVVGVDVLYACFVEGDVGFSENEEVFNECLGGLAGWNFEGRGEGCEGAVDGVGFCENVGVFGA